MRSIPQKLLAVTALLVLAACSTGPPIQMNSIGEGLETLRSRFNQDTGKVRLLLLLDPT
jgi:hypothetical protein